MSCIIKDGKYYNNQGQESKLYKDLVERVGEEQAHELFVLSHTHTFFLNKSQSEDLQKEIESKYVNKLTDLFDKNLDDIRMKVFNYDSPIAQKEINGVDLRIAEGLIRNKKKTFLLYANGQIIGEFPSVQLIKDTIANIESRLLKEPTAQEVLLYAENNFALTEPLTSEEIFDLSTLQLEDVETSEDLYDILSDAFYKDNVFSPQIKKLKKIYSETEIRNILEDVEIQARIKETIEKLRFTKPFNITQVEKNKDYGYKELTVNIIGQYKAGLDKPQEGVEVDVIDENGNIVENKLIYDNAVRVVDDPKIIDAIEAIISAPQTVETEKVQNKVVNWLKDYGLNIGNLSRENYPILRDFIANPTDENTIQLEQSLGFERSPKKEIVKIETPLNRSYKFLRTVKSEQQLFDELSLIKTNTPNVYHQINKLEEEQMRTLMKNEDLTVPIYELYKEYFGYSEGVNEGVKINTNIQTDPTYLVEEFVADFAVEKLKNPNSFNELFKITENGIELISTDELTMAKVLSQIENYPALQDYSLVSKTLPELKLEKKSVDTKEDRRVQAVNNKQSIPTPKSEITIIDDQFIKALNETSEFLRIGESLFEMQEEGVYSKLNFEENPNYYTFNVEVPTYKTFDEKLEKPSEVKPQKMISKEEEQNNFGCL